MTKLQELTKAIQRVCPELMQLSVGCWVKTSDPDAGICQVIRTGASLIQVITEEEYLWKMHEDDCEVLGHPIQLRHVLRALNQIKRIDYGLYPFIPENYVFIEIGLQPENYTFTNTNWDLAKPLSGQTEETITWLHKLLCNPER